MTTSNYARGRRAEEELVTILKILRLRDAKRVPLSGGGQHTRGQPDITVTRRDGQVVTISVKFGKGVPKGAHTLVLDGTPAQILFRDNNAIVNVALSAKFVRKARGTANYLALRRPGRPWIITGWTDIPLVPEYNCDGGEQR